MPVWTEANHYTFRAMGSPCEFRLFGDAAQLEKAARAAIQEIQRLEKKYSRYLPDNYMSRLNQAANEGGQVQIDEECRLLLEYANSCYQQSDGLFDISSGVLRKLWNFEKTQLPEPSAIEAMQAQIGWQYVSWNEHQLCFARAGMELDFGGLVKEYAADCAVTVLKEHGITSGLVDLGGDISVVGPLPDGSAWQIAIRHPRNAGETFVHFSLKSGALASSGDYERAITIDGKRYSHILSPKTGWPVSGLAAVSVAASSCILAGSSCTIAMLKEFQGPQWLAELSLNHAWMDIHGEVGGSVSFPEETQAPPARTC